MEGSICIRTNLDDEQIRLITVGSALHSMRGLNGLFFDPKYHKISLAKYPFCTLFQIPPSRVVFDRQGMCLATLCS